MTPTTMFQVFLAWYLTSCAFPTHSYSISPSRSNKKTTLPVHHSQPHFIPTLSSTRRAFFLGAASVATVAVVAVASDPIPRALAVASPPPLSQVIKVTPLAHTFSVSKGAAKPVRENDATRTLANARIVYLFEGPAGGGSGGENARTVEEILRLTAARKEGAGPGVTPGKVKFVCHAPGTSVAAAGDHKDLAAVAEGCGVEVVRVRNPHDLQVVASLATSADLADGDVLIVCPQPSGGTARDAKVVADCAALTKLDVGGAKSGGVLSVLVNGPRSPDTLNVLEGGFETSTVLWYEA